jgi:hypothetical protein
MKHISKVASIAIAFLAMSVSFEADAQRGRAVADADPAQIAAPLSPRARGELARQFVSKWGDHVVRVYDVDVGVWARRMVGTFVVADPANFRNALKRATFEGAMAELNGVGHRLSDQRAVGRLIHAARSDRPDATAKVLGDVVRDLVYTPLQPCRIVDTRNTAAGAIPGNATRSFFALSSDFSAQGGTAGDCGTGALSSVGAVAINVTAVTPTGAGFATVFPFNTAQPLTSSVNYTAGAIVNNAIITRIPSPLTTGDFTIFTFAQAHYVVDLVGYFSPPQATQFQCTQTALTATTIPANGINFFNNPGCPAGYSAVLPYCYTDAPGVHAKGSGFNGNNPAQPTFCNWQNTTASPQTVFGGTVCCRVPGR